MKSMLRKLREKFFSPAQPQNVRRRPRYVRLGIEDLEDRLVLDAYTFTGGPNGNGTAWNVAQNWLDNNTRLPGVPGAGDSALIGGPYNVVVPAQTSASVGALTLSGTLSVAGSFDANSVNATVSGSSFLGVASKGTATIGTLGFSGSGGLDSKGNIVGLDVAGTLNATDITPSAGATVESGGLLTVGNSASLGGLVNIYGQLSAGGNANVTLGGTVTIGPGDLNGTLAGAAGSTITLGTGTTTFLSGATLAAGTYNVDVTGTASLMGTLKDPTVITLDGGTISGGGSLDVTNEFDWRSGTLAVPTTIESSGTLQSNQSTGMTLSSTLDNESMFCTLGGTGSLTITSGGKFENVAGQTVLSLPSVIVAVGTPGGAFVNDATGTLDVQSSGGATISGSFTNTGNLDVGSGSGLTLTTASGGTDDLSGTLQLGSDLTLLGTIGSTMGFIEDAGSGTLKVGDGTNAGALTLPSGDDTMVSGNLEVTKTGTLTEGGKLDNDGHLTLDYGSATTLSAYSQSSTGTLEIQVMGPGASSAPTVTGTAGLAGTLLVDYVGYPVGSGQSFPVLSANSLGGHFDTAPGDLTLTYGSGGVTATKN